MFIPTTEQVDAFIAALNNAGNEREAVVARLASSCPLRIKDILSLSPECVNGNEVTTTSKSGREVVSVLSGEAIAIIQGWMIKQPGKFVFQSASGGSLDASYVRRLFRAAATKEAPINADALRRFWAHQAYHDKGMSLSEIKALLGRKQNADAASYIGLTL